MDRKLLSVREAAALLGISHWRLRRWAKAGLVPAIKVGRRFLFRRPELDRWVLGEAGGRDGGAK